jgi:hypothetical protein
MNGNSGITPTVELATTNGAYPYPVMYGNNGGFGNGGFLGGDGIWAILLFALLFGNGGWGNGGFGFGGNGFDNGYAWLSNGQKEIMNNTNNGFDTLHLSNQIEGVRDGVYGLSNQMCNSTSDIVSAVNNGFSNAEISANGRQIANMQQAFNSEIATLNGFNNINNSLQNCCCENRLGVQDLKSTVISENCSDREVLRQIGQDILVNQTANTQKIIDEIFRDRLDEKDSKIADLNRQLQMADLRASQVAQTQAITSNVYNELKNCPIGTVPVFGNQPIFTCPNNLNGGCGCGFNTTSQFI